MPQHAEAYEHLVTLLTGKFDVDPEQVRPDATYEELNLDSITVVELFVTLSDHWNTVVDDSLAVPGTTLAETAELVVNSAREAA